MANKYVTPRRLSTFLDNLKNTFALLGHKHTTSDITDYKVDSALSSTSSNPVANRVLDAEFDAVSQAMGALETSIDNTDMKVENLSTKVAYIDTADNEDVVDTGDNCVKTVNGIAPDANGNVIVETSDDARIKEIIIDTLVDANLISPLVDENGDYIADENDNVLLD